MTDNGEIISSWKTPEEVMRLHKLKVRKKALQARMDCPKKIGNTVSLIAEEQFIGKRSNPFLKNTSEQNKRFKFGPDSSPVTRNNSSNKSLFDLVTNTEQTKIILPKEAEPVKQTVSSKNDIYDYLEESNEKPKDIKGLETLPVDWSIKTRIRLLSQDSMPGHPKTSQEASGLTSFVRCIYPSSYTADIGGGSLDTSLGARIQQAALYWTHPSLPGEKLFPRKTRGSTVVASLPQGALLSEWADSFRSLFQLLRAKQCPYFYLCANSFTALFRAAGVGGEVEPHVFISPTTQGFRQTLKQEDIEFTMPLRKSERKSFENSQSIETQTENEKNASNIETTVNNEHDDDDDDDDESHEQWLQSLGVDESEIKKINYSQARKDHASECKEDLSDMSLVSVQGPDLQALYNFLLNSKSTVGGIGVIPPTLLSPTAFLGSSLKTLQIRHSRVRVEGSDYQSIELRGPILPNAVRSLCDALSSTRDRFSVTTATSQGSQALSKAAKSVIKNIPEADIVFGCENLSGCGLPKNFLHDICASKQESITHTDSMRYKSDQGYTWGNVD